jgi:ATP-dependent DNA helicase HFM1/MER3
METDENIILSAPTGSGKTVVFELAIIHMLINGSNDAKGVYVAPTKARSPAMRSSCKLTVNVQALCAERFRDWTSKFEGIGLKCMQLVCL